MTLDASRELPYGPLETIEVYFEHDGPKFFAMRSASLGIRLLVLCTGEDEEAGTVEYLYLALSSERFQLIRGGLMTLRTAFAVAARAEIWRVVEDFSSDPPRVHASPIEFDQIPDIDLPDEGARLALPTATAPALDANALQMRAAESYRTYAAIELDATGQNLTEFPIRQLGAIGELFQESIDALAQEVLGSPTIRGVIPAHITADVQMNAVELRAASFAVVVATDNRNVLVENTRLVEATLGRLLDLIDAGHDPVALVGALREYQGRARSKVVNLLRAVVDADSGFGVIIGPRQGAPSKARLTAQEVRDAVDAVSVVKPEEHTINVEHGYLIGSNTRTTTFELDYPGRNTRYSGKVIGDAIDQIDGLPVGSNSAVTATIVEEVAFSPANPDGGRKYYLLDIQSLLGTGHDGSDT